MATPYEPVKPYEGEYKLKRDHLAKYLCRVGRGINCRMDVPVLTVEDVKWAATVFAELYQELAEIAYKDDRPDIYRILAARYAMEGARNKLSRTNDKAEGTKKYEKAKEKLMQKGGYGGLKRKD